MGKSTDEMERLALDPSKVAPSTFPYAKDPKERLTRIEATRFTDEEGVVIDKLSMHLRLARAQFLRCMFRQAMPQMREMLAEFERLRGM